MRKKKAESKVSLKMPETILNGKAFGAWLLATRKHRGLSQDALGESIGGMSGSRVQQWEKAVPDKYGNPSYPPLDMIVALSKSLNVDVRIPLTILGVLKDVEVEITPDEYDLLTAFRLLPEAVDKLALDIIQLLSQLKAGRAKRKPQRKRPASGTLEENQATG